MIIIRSQGRLGNQLFQYAAVMKAARPRERVFLVGFVELRRHFGSGADSRARWLSYRLYSHLRRLPKKCLWLPLVGTLSLSADGAYFRRKRGMFPLFNFTAGYCQDYRLVSHQAAQNLTLVLGDKISPAQSRGTDIRSFRCFVHIRRGDYLRLANFSSPPLAWFQTQMDVIRKKYRGVTFLACSDDPTWVKDVFKGDPSVKIFDGNEKEVLHLMSECDAGILSPSSFSWWGAYFALNRQAPGPFIAPQYWLGWKTGKWYPSRIENTVFYYVPVTA